MPESQHILVATLGGQPQVVTFTLDLLLQRGYPISEVIVLHPDPKSQPRLQRALERLNVEFSGEYYQTVQRHISFRSHVLEYKGRPIDDIIDNEHADGTLDSLQRLIGELKRRAYCIHLSVSGGRRMIALLALSVATLNFDRYDCIWHIYTPDILQEQAHNGEIMHMPADAGIKLIRGPFLALGAYIYSSSLSFRSVQEEQRLQMDAQERIHCAEVVNLATPAQRKVLEAFARGLRPQQVAEELGITTVTVNTHKTILLNYCHQVWKIPSDERLDYHFLRSKFAEYFQNIQKPDDDVRNH